MLTIRQKKMFQYISICLGFIKKKNNTKKYLKKKLRILHKWRNFSKTENYFTRHNVMRRRVNVNNLNIFQIRGEIGESSVWAGQAVPQVNTQIWNLNYA